MKKDQESEVDYNSAIFIKKHPNAMGLSSADLKALFRSIATRYKYLEKILLPNTNVIVIHFKEAEKLDQLKECILQLLTVQNINIIIYDYVETTNLDIWVQLQSINDHIVKYYPISQCKPK